MTDADLAMVHARVAVATSRVTKIATPDSGLVVAKTQRPGRSAWRGRVVDALARAVGMPLLRAVAAPGGAAAQAIEVSRLCSLAAAGVRVPEVLHVDPRFIVLRHLEGPILVHGIEAGGAAGFAAWASGLDAIADVHARGACLSQAFARNFLVTPAGLAMFDFEDDPLAAMTLDEAQARDWLAYLHSSAWLLDDPPMVQRAALDARLARARPPVRGLVLASGRRLRALRRLPRSRRVWGREVAGLRALARLFTAGAGSPEKQPA
jgi:hypothetical protein